MKILIFGLALALGAVAQQDVCDDILEGRRIPHPVAEVNKCYECEKLVPLGIKSGHLISLTASNSALNAPPTDARLGNPDSAWCAHPADEKPYLEVDFGKVVTVRKILLQGSQKHNAWVKKVHVQYKKKNDGPFEYLKDDQDYVDPKVFNGSADCDTVADIDLNLPIPTSSIRIFPVDSKYKACMRLEVEECRKNDEVQTTSNSYAALKAQDYRISNYKLCRKTCEDCFPKCIKYKLDGNGCVTCECVPEIEIPENEKYEGDIIMTTETKKYVGVALNTQQQTKDVPEGVQMGAGRQGKITRWNNRNGKEVIIPYDDSAMSSRGRSALQQAVADFNRYTCIRLKRRTNERNYIRYFVGGGCYSPVGMSRSYNQVSIGPGCDYKGTVIHETMHSLGFWHEQSRPDRDGAVTIQWQNIPSSVQYNFQKHSTNDIDSMGFGYDISSVMHYGSYAFSNTGRPTITDKQGKPISTQRNGMSTDDYQQINKMYGCGDTGVTLPPTSCTNDHKNCEYWAGVGECKKSASYMLVNCKKACKVCGGIKTTTTKKTTTTTTQKPTTTTIKKTTTATIEPNPSECVDKNAKCPIWAGYGLCDEEALAVVKVLCKKSCGFCGATTTSPPLPVGCEDRLEDCTPYKDYCKDEAYKKSLEYWCKKTCNIC